MIYQPKISVIMGIYNCEATLPQAIDSILAQTYTNWELVMCEDGSTDGTYSVAKRYADQYPQKMVLLKNERNMKLSYTLNRCLQAASGELVARMDGDDLSHPERFQRQVDFLMEHPDIQLVGTGMRRFDEDGYHDVMHPLMNPDSKALLRSTPFFHATIMTYKSVYDALGGYTTEKRTQRAQDVDLWFRFYAKHFTGSNIDEPLYDVREDEQAIRRRSFKARIYSIQTRAHGYKILGFPLRWLIRPAIILFLKGLVPSSVAAWIHKYKMKRKEKA